MAKMFLTFKAAVLWLALSTALLPCKAEDNLRVTSHRLLKRHAVGDNKELADALDRTRAEIESTIMDSISRLQRKIESRLAGLEATMDETLQALKNSNGRQRNTLPVISGQREIRLEHMDQMVDQGFNTCELPTNLASALNEFNSLISQTKTKVSGESVCVKALDSISSMEKRINDTMVTVENRWNSFTEVDSRCEEGWHYYEDSCYYFSYNEFRWAEGRQECLRKGGDYAKINSTEEWSHVASQISGSSWIGLNDIDEEGNFRWISDGSELGEMDDSWWLEGQPDNYQGKEDCVHYWVIYNKVIWNDQDCASKLRVICEKLPMDSAE